MGDDRRDYLKQCTHGGEIDKFETSRWWGNCASWFGVLFTLIWGLISLCTQAILTKGLDTLWGNNIVMRTCVIQHVKRERSRRRSFVPDDSYSVFNPIPGVSFVWWQGRLVRQLFSCWGGGGDQVKWWENKRGGRSLLLWWEKVQDCAWLLVTGCWWLRTTKQCTREHYRKWQRWWAKEREKKEGGRHHCAYTFSIARARLFCVI